MREESKFIEEVVAINRVTKVTSGGRQLRFQALVVVGDGKGQVGIGVGKSLEVIAAVDKATARAKKRLFKLDTSLGTIPHPISAKYKASRVLLIPAAPGTGIIAGGIVRKIVGLAGYHNMLSKIQGSNNKLNNAKATLMALLALKPINSKDYRYEEAKKELAMIEEQRRKEEVKKQKEAKARMAKKDDRKKGKRNSAKPIEEVSESAEVQEVKE